MFNFVNDPTKNFIKTQQQKYFSYDIIRYYINYEMNIKSTELCKIFKYDIQRDKYISFCIYSNLQIYEIIIYSMKWNRSFITNKILISSIRNITMHVRITRFWLNLLFNHLIRVSERIPRDVLFNSPVIDGITAT